MTEQLIRIREKIENRKLTLNPVASEIQVRAFEERHGITLPIEYRLFLTQLGNGGPGPPSYGLFPLGELPGGLFPEGRRLWSQLPHVRKPFPFTHYWIWDTGGTTAEGTQDDTSSGSILIGDDGCGAYFHLIVMGPDFGVPWMIAFEGIQPICPKRSFLQWYEDWLDGRDSFYGFPEKGASDPTPASED